MTKEEFLGLSPIEQDSLVELTKERQNRLNDIFNDESLTDEEFLDLTAPIYLEQAIENGIVE